MQDVQSRIGTTAGKDPNIVFTTDATYSTATGIAVYGKALYGYVNGGDPSNTWGCRELESTPVNTGCKAGNGWRQLTVPLNGTADDWQKNPTRNNRIERSAVSLS